MDIDVEDGEIKNAYEEVNPELIQVLENASMAFGPETIPSVDKIVGASEIVILANERGEPGWIAADMIAQVEHDPKATNIRITTSQEPAEKVN